MLQPSHIQVSHGPQHRQEQLQILQARGQELRGRNEDLEQQLAMMSSEATGAIGKGWRSPRSIKRAKFWVLFWVQGVLTLTHHRIFFMEIYSDLIFKLFFLCHQTFNKMMPSSLEKKNNKLDGF